MSLTQHEKVTPFRVDADRPARPRRRRVTRWLRILVPAVGFTLLAVVVIWPLLNPSEPGFTLSFSDATHVDNRLRMETLRFEGTDEKGRPFTVTAASASQQGVEAPLVELHDVSASMTLDDGTWINADAPSGLLREADDKLTLNGTVNLYSSLGYEVHGSDVKLDFNTHVVSSDQPVKGQGPLGTFEATGFEGDLASQRITLEKKVHVIIYPKGQKGDG
jgi:lipopolysaccharide export system protein LptC